MDSMACSPYATYYGLWTGNHGQRPVDPFGIISMRPMGHHALRPQFSSGQKWPESTFPPLRLKQWPLGISRGHKTTFLTNSLKHRGELPNTWTNSLQESQSGHIYCYIPLCTILPPNSNGQNTKAQFCQMKTGHQSFNTALKEGIPGNQLAIHGG
ncbi:hypothetical protein O181_102813 [Austropuccinia psidii MF-1]|uniref:Uncharacterized protein n=1 Tax=Austropuccinia psidii MF-1 TaxID=1389203 RepID=A0A9Q3JJ60_9BASI|nr:hypothetical protein [Austropuccinia psidii MF-1]